MRDYAKVMPKFWSGETCKRLRRRGFEAPYMALYLMSAPASNMLGLYYQPILFMAHETGLGVEGASKGLQACIEAGFCKYDEDSEMVWVIEMASFQIASELKASDKRCKGVQKDYDNLPTNPFLGEFFDRYEQCFHLTNRRAIEAPSKPHRSQEQEQEQEQETRKNTSSDLPELDLNAQPPPDTTTERFETLWQSWPSNLGAKGSKSEARTRFLKIKPDNQLFEVMCLALKDQAKDKNQKREAGVFFENFPHVVRWLSKARWEDEIPTDQLETESPELID